MCLSFGCIHGSYFIYFTDSGVLGKIKRYWVLIVSISEEISQNIRQRDCHRPRKCHSLFSARSKTPVDVTQPNANVWFVHSLLRSSLLLFQKHAIEYEVNFSIAFTNLEFEVSWCMERASGKACISQEALNKSCSPGPSSSCAWCNTVNALKQACSSDVLPYEQMHTHVAPYTFSFGDSLLD